MYRSMLIDVVIGGKGDEKVACKCIGINSIMGLIFIYYIEFIQFINKY